MTINSKLNNEDPVYELNGMNSLLIVCGETSSDEHTAPIVSSIKEKNPLVEIYGMGGGCLEKEGMELTVDARETASVMGFTEVVGKIGVLIKALRRILHEVDKRNTKVAILVDFPDFNLLLAKALKKRGVKVLYFISPQLWAWRSGRISKMKSYVDKIFPIFPFEEEFYKSHNVKATFVGHPFLYKKSDNIDLNEFKKRYSLENYKTLIALLPGSRKAEVSKIFPVMHEMATKYKNNSEVLFIVPVAHNVSQLFEEYKNLPENVKLIDGHAKEVLSISSAAVVASGTATVEAALCRVPFCIVYKVSPLTYLIGKLLIKGVTQVGMPNLILKEKLLKEFIQDDYTSGNLEEELERLLNDNEYRNYITAGLDKVRELLTKDDIRSYSEIVADEALKSLAEKEL